MKTRAILGALALATATLTTACDKGPETAGISADGRCPHEIKADRCPFCNPELVEAEGFCGEHGVAEALCAQCRPYLGVAFRAQGDWCAGHNVPESQCVKCNPELAANLRPGEHAGAAPGTDPHDHATDAGHDHDAHGNDAHDDDAHDHSAHDHEAHDASAGPGEDPHAGHNHAPGEHAEAEPVAERAGADLRWQRSPSPTCAASSTPVLLSSPETAGAVGLEYAKAGVAPLARTVERNAELTYNANRYARVSSRAEGVVAEILTDLGARVHAGDVLIIIESTDLGAAKSDLLQSIETAKLWEANAALERDLVEKGVGIEREALEASTRAAEGRIGVDRARQRLRTLGLSQAQIDTVEREADTSSRLPILAPFDGTIVERTTAIGEVVEARHALLAIADTSTMWAMADLAEADLALVHVGQPATVTLDGLPGATFPGRVAWISTQLDPHTRTLHARIELDNGSGMLRANMFGRAEITAGGNRAALTVPKEAVQWEGCCNIAFVRVSGDDAAFRPARLRLGYDAGDRYEVLEGLAAGDTVVTRGSFILKNEILKDSIGAGCCEVGHLDK